MPNAAGRERDSRFPSALSDFISAFKLVDRTHCTVMNASPFSTRRAAMEFCMTRRSCGGIACTHCRTTGRAPPAGMDERCPGRYHVCPAGLIYYPQRRHREHGRTADSNGENKVSNSITLIGTDGEHGYSCLWAKRPQPPSPPPSPPSSPPPPPPPFPPPPPSPPPTSRIFDCFIFGQRELAVLQLRIDTVCGAVDEVIVSHGTTAHSGQELRTPFLDERAVAELRARCSSSRRTEIHAVWVETRAAMRSHHRNWASLHVQTAALVIKARALGMRRTDLLVISEHDEIPNPQVSTL